MLQVFIMINGAALLFLYVCISFFRKTQTKIHEYYLCLNFLLGVFEKKIYIILLGAYVCSKQHS